MKMKRVVSLLLTLVMMLSFAVTANAAGSISLEVGESESIQAAPYSNAEYVWSSDDPSVASVSGSDFNATVVGVGAGSTTITVTITIQGEDSDDGNGGVVAGTPRTETEQWSVSVTAPVQPEPQPEPEPEPEPAYVSITIDPNDIYLTQGDSETLRVDFYMGSATDVSTWEWDSSNSSAIRVDGSGTTARVTAVSEGRSTISVAAYDASGTQVGHATCSVSGKAAYQPLSVTGGRSLTIKAGSSENVSATVSGGSGEYSWEWDYDRSGTAAVRDSMRNNAEIYGMDAGSGSVTLTVYDLNDRSSYASTTWNVTVESTSAPLTASMRPASETMKVGDTVSFAVDAAGGSGNNSNYVYNWYATSGVVSISSTGAVANVTAVGIGAASVKVDVQDKTTGTVVTATANVNVQGGSGSYNASGSATVGANYPLGAIGNNIANEFRNYFGFAVSGSATVQFTSPSGNIGAIRAANGTYIKAYESVSYNSLASLNFLATNAGTFSTAYSLTEKGNTISGTLSITATGGAAVTGVTISNDLLNMATYSNRAIGLNITPVNANCTITWTSSDTRIATVSGSGASVLVNSQGRVGSAVITARVTSANGVNFDRSCAVYVSSSSVYNPTLTVTLYSDYYGTAVTDSVAKQFRNVYGYNLVNRDTTMTFSSTGNTRYGMMRLANGSAIRANTAYSFDECINMYFEPLASGTFSLPYRLSYRGDVLEGTLDIYIRESNVRASISQSSLTLATYSNQALSVSVSPSNVYYTVSWRSTNTNVATVTGSGISATVKTGGTTGTATIYATVTDRNGVEVHRSCTVTVSNKNNSFSPGVSTIIGVPYKGTGTYQALKDQFKAVYGIELKDNATVRFSAMGNTAIAVLRTKDGAAVQANKDYTFAEYRDMYTEPVSAGTYSCPYTLTYNGKTLTGNGYIVIDPATVTASISLGSMDPYTFSSNAVGGSTGSSLLGSSVTNAIGSNWSYVRFGTPTSAIGTLYKNSQRTALGNANIAQTELGSLYFVPAYAGDYSIGFTAYNSAGNTLANGTLYIRVSSSAATPMTSISFGDVKSSDWYGSSVLWAVGRGITNGMGKNAQGQETFQPLTTCKTAHILTFLWRSQGSPAPSISNPFTNIKSTDYYYNAAIWAYEKGLITGTVFDGAQRDCTRAEAVIYMWKLAGKPGAPASSFTDVPQGTDMASAIAWAVAKNITSGTGNNRFSPDDICNRGHIVTFLCRAYA